MRNEKGKHEAVYPLPALPGGPERPENMRWPSPTPSPAVPPEDIGRVLKRILDRLHVIEKRLENIEKLLLEKRAP